MSNIKNGTIATALNKLPTIAAAINEQHDLATCGARTAVEHAIECGRLLIEAKGKLAHGQFGCWIETHCTFSIATANNYMKAAGILAR